MRVFSTPKEREGDKISNADQLVGVARSLEWLLFLNPPTLLSEHRDTFAFGSERHVRRVEFLKGVVVLCR